jgi:hypothetical protein
MRISSLTASASNTFGLSAPPASKAAGASGAGFFIFPRRGFAGSLVLVVPTWLSWLIDY